MTGVLLKRGNLDSEERKGYVKTETQRRRTCEDRAETGLMQLQVKIAKDCRPPAEAGKRQGRVLPRASEGAWPYRHLDFGLLASRTVRR